MKRTKELFPKYDISVRITETCYNASFYERGIMNSNGIHAYGCASACAALDMLDEKFVSERNKRKAARTLSMAEAVMRVTYRLGECTDAALRGEGFDQYEIDAYGPDAVEQANDTGKMAPFAIKAHGASANAEGAS
jgi:hypothetical protein